MVKCCHRHRTTRRRGRESEADQCAEHPDRGALGRHLRFGAAVRVGQHFERANLVAGQTRVPSLLSGYISAGAGLAVGIGQGLSGVGGGGSSMPKGYNPNSLSGLY
jgi:hypothetical protein